MRQYPDIRTKGSELRVLGYLVGADAKDVLEEGVASGLAGDEVPLRPRGRPPEMWPRWVTDGEPGGPSEVRTDVKSRLNQTRAVTRSPLGEPAGSS